MPSFKVSFGSAKSKGHKTASKYDVIEAKCEGTICIDEQGVYKVNYKGTMYAITSESYETKNKKTIYARWLDPYGHRIKISRDKDSKRRTNVKFYCAIAPGLYCKGTIVKTAFGPILFHVTTCYNISDMEGMVLSIREWREYEERIKNNEIDINNKL